VLTICKPCDLHEAILHEKAFQDLSVLSITEIARGLRSNEWGRVVGQKAGELTRVPSPCAMPTARAGNAPRRCFTCLSEKLHEPREFSKASAASLHTLSHSSAFFGWPPRMPITLSSESTRRWVVL
jgi:hypothetical protein